MNILMTTDGQKYSEEAIRFAGMLFKKAAPNVTIIHVRPYEARETKKEARKYLDIAKGILSTFDIKPKLKMLQGDIVKEIMMELKDEDYDLLVLGSKSVSRVMMGVADSLLQKPLVDVAKSVRCSVLIVKDPPKTLNQVLVCTDGSPFAEMAANFWGKLSKEHEPRAVVLNIIPQLFSGFSSEFKSVTPDLLKVLAKVPGSRTKVVNRAKDILERYGIEVKTKLREREYAAEEILKEEREVDYDLIVMGYRGRKYRTKIQAGSQSLEVAKNSQTSVLIYQPRRVVD
ncbi:MAG: universal stress protein [bacterium]|nr:universal stress protein [bacterium]